LILETGARPEEIYRIRPEKAYAAGQGASTEKASANRVHRKPHVPGRKGEERIMTPRPTTIPATHEEALLLEGFYLIESLEARVGIEPVWHIEDT
jgi:hypothetical protein